MQVYHFRRPISVYGAPLERGAGQAHDHGYFMLTRQDAALVAALILLALPAARSAHAKEAAAFPEGSYSA